MNAPLCFYDGYLALTEETIDLFSHPDQQRKFARAQGIDALRDMLAVDPSFLDPVRQLLQDYATCSSN